MPYKRASSRHNDTWAKNSYKKSIYIQLKLIDFFCKLMTLRGFNKKKVISNWGNFINLIQAEYDWDFTSRGASYWNLISILGSLQKVQDKTGAISGSCLLALEQVRLPIVVVAKSDTGSYDCCWYCCCWLLWDRKKDGREEDMLELLLRRGGNDTFSFVKSFLWC